LRVDTFSGDFDELERLVETVWGAKYGHKTRFRYPARWLADFFGPPGARRELLLEYRDGTGALAAFVGATPRRCLVGGREVRVELVTLLTSTPRNSGLVAFELLRETLRRAASPGTYGTYHCCLEGDRTPELLEYVARSHKLAHVELAAVPSLIGQTRRVSEGEVVGVRTATAADSGVLAEIVAAAEQPLPIGRVITAADFTAILELPGARRLLVLTRGDAPVGLCLYTRRQIHGAHTTEIANIDLLIAPGITLPEAQRFGRAIADDSAVTGATLLLGYQRVPALFAHTREAGLRLARRTLRVFLVPNEGEVAVEPGSAHLLEIE
jgi:hypothetical protein